MIVQDVNPYFAFREYANVFEVIIPDVLHVFELGVFKALFKYFCVEVER